MCYSYYFYYYYNYYFYNYYYNYYSYYYHYLQWLPRPINPGTGQRCRDTLATLAQSLDEFSSPAPLLVLQLKVDSSRISKWLHFTDQEHLHVCRSPGCSGTQRVCLLTYKDSKTAESFKKNFPQHFIKKGAVH